MSAFQPGHIVVRSDEDGTLMTVMEAETVTGRFIGHKGIVSLHGYHCTWFEGTRRFMRWFPETMLLGVYGEPGKGIGLTKRYDEFNIRFVEDTEEEESAP